jgi:uncharacterized protein (DUF2225 family)
MKRLMFAVTVLIVIWGGILDADGGTYTCPICKGKVETGYGYSSQDWSSDRDFFISGNDPAEDLLVCPTCSFIECFSLFKEPRDVSTDMAANVRRTIRAFLRRFPGQTVQDLPSWRKCELAAELSIVLELGSRWTAWSFLRAAWTTRYMPGIFTADNPRPQRFDTWGKVWDIKYTYWSRARILAPSSLLSDIELTVARLMEKDYESRSIPRQERPYWVMEFAEMHRDHGEHESALAYLNRLERDFAPLPADLRSVVKAMRMSIALEKYYQGKVIEHFTLYHESNCVAADYVAKVRFLIGETYRRLGDKEKAEEWFRKVYDAPLVYGDVKEWTERGLQDIQSRFSPTPAQIRRLDEQLAAGLLGYVQNPHVEMRDFTLKERLESIRNPTVLAPGLLAASEHPNAEIRGRAVECMIFKGPGVIDRLCTLLETDPDIDVRLACVGVIFKQDWNCRRAVPALIKAHRYVNDEFDKPGVMRDYIGYYFDDILSTLAHLGGHEATAFLFVKAREEIPGLLERMKSGKEPMCDEWENLVEALGILGDKAAIPLLTGFLEQEEDEELRDDIGESLEHITNRYFGFSFTENGLRGEDVPLPHEDPLVNWKSWWAEHKNESVETWRNDGFTFYGYDPGHLSDPPNLSAYVEALGDSRGAVRFNAWRELSRLVGHLFGSRLGRPSTNPDFALLYIHARYHQWLQRNKGRLVWNKGARRYDKKLK